MKQHLSPLLRIVAIVIGLFVAPAANAEKIRVAAYNIQFLKDSIPNDRKQNLQDTIAALDADVIVLNEIADRAALENIFDKTVWNLVIDDQSGDDQDVAVAVRMPLTVVSPSDNEADDSDFLFPGTTNNTNFPNRRDVLCVTIRQPGNPNPVEFTVMAIHAKSRFGGRADTDFRRAGAAVDLLHALEQNWDDKKFILLGDWNDNPDDRSLNILETGDPNAVFAMEQDDGPFLMNLMEPLCAMGHVSHGRSSNDINTATSRINIVDVGSRQRNADHRNDNTNTGDILFDQILIPMSMKNAYVADSARVFDQAVAIQGASTSRASDHLPIYAEFEFGGSPGSGGSITPVEPGTVNLRIVAMLPNPDGDDAGHETVTIANLGNESIDLNGWKLRDRARNEFALSGTIAGNGQREITLQLNSMPLNNTGDDVFLVDPQGHEVDKATYKEAEAKGGQTVSFPH